MDKHDNQTAKQKRTKTPRPCCEACGEQATCQDADGVWLCQGDYDHLVEHWVLEGMNNAR